MPKEKQIIIEGNNDSRTSRLLWQTIDDTVTYPGNKIIGTGFGWRERYQGKPPRTPSSCISEWCTPRKQQSITMCKRNSTLSESDKDFCAGSVFDGYQMTQQWEETCKSLTDCLKQAQNINNNCIASCMACRYPACLIGASGQAVSPEGIIWPPATPGNPNPIPRPITGGYGA